eukprot:TRINITY_DN14645_c0_g1_i1.p1 TRINITY_DN14645_c0_g1~~TRINITY_DN14645_c0_g1_i1.p1  ORF type:complete len:125 (-),score=16.32 TRINITY_DN14645_c0_g1_i1:16-390(-)
MEYSETLVCNKQKHGCNTLTTHISHVLFSAGCSLSGTTLLLKALRVASSLHHGRQQLQANGFPYCPLALLPAVCCQLLRAEHASHRLFGVEAAVAVAVVAEAAGLVICSGILVQCSCHEKRHSP